MLENLKKLLIIMVTIVMFLVGTQTMSSAMSVPSSIPSFSSPTTTPTPSSNTSGSSTIPNYTAPTASPSPSPSPSAKISTGVTTTNKSLPKTGVDYSIVFIILACIVCAIFAYKKVKDYNIKY